MAPWLTREVPARERGMCERESGRKKDEEEGPRERARGRPGATAVAGSRRAAGLERVRREKLREARAKEQMLLDEGRRRGSGAMGCAGW